MTNRLLGVAFLAADGALVLIFCLLLNAAIAPTLSEPEALAQSEYQEIIVIQVVITNTPNPTATSVPSLRATATNTPFLARPLNTVTPKPPIRPSRAPTEEPTKPPYVFPKPIYIPP